MKILFWGLVAIDLLGILLWFVLGLAAAGSTKDSPFTVMLLLLVLPCVPLAGAVVLFLRSASPLGRGFALLLAATPLLVIAGGRAISEFMMRSTTNEAGEMTYFRSGPKRELAEAIGRNDSAAVAALIPKVDVNDAGLMGVTPLIIAVRQLRETPEQQAVLRMLIQAGANPNKSAQYEYPLAIAIQVSDKAGVEPVKMLLDAKADPNTRDSFGDPLWFQATGVNTPAEVLTLLLDRGAEINTVAKNGSTILFQAANTRNWKLVLLLLERGADWRLGKSVNGMPFKNLVEGEIGSQGGDSTYQRVRRFLQAKDPS